MAPDELHCWGTVFLRFGEVAIMHVERLAARAIVIERMPIELQQATYPTEYFAAV